MTKEDWKQIEHSLSYSYGAADLVVDGREVALRVVRGKGLRYVIAVYVDGWMKGEWFTHDCEERRRFMRPVVSVAAKPSEIARMRKACGKRYAEQFRQRMTFTYYQSFWPSFVALRRHLVKNNQSIELKASSELKVTNATPAA
ncbi:MAG: hypothetical protein ABI843_02380 [Dokdonella sp.]